MSNVIILRTRVSGNLHDCSFMPLKQGQGGTLWLLHIDYDSLCQIKCFIPKQIDRTLGFGPMIENIFIIARQDIKLMHDL